MSDDNRKRASSGSSFGFGLTGLIGTIVAYCNTASFVGWAGVGKSLLVGAGTSMGATFVAIPSAIAGALTGGAIGAAIGGLLGRDGDSAETGALIGAATVGVASGLGGGIYGAIEGYHVSKGWLTETAPITTTFNAAAPRNAPQVGVTTAPAAPLPQQWPGQTP